MRSQLPQVAPSVERLEQLHHVSVIEERMPDNPRRRGHEKPAVPMKYDEGCHLAFFASAMVTAHDVGLNLVGVRMKNRLPSLPQRYVRYLLAFGVSIGVGLAPLLGQVDVPGFTAILAVYPLNLRDSLIAFSAFLMSLPAVALQFYATSRVPIRRLQLLFGGFLLAASMFCIALLISFAATVVEVPFKGGRGVARYVVGATQLPDCPCAGKDIETCVGRQISFNPAKVEACFPGREIRFRKLLLSLLYVATMMSFGALIGTLILREVQRDRHR